MAQPKKHSPYCSEITNSIPNNATAVCDWESREPSWQWSLGGRNVSPLSIMVTLANRRYQWSHACGGGKTDFLRVCYAVLWRSKLKGCRNTYLPSSSPAEFCDRVELVNGWELANKNGSTQSRIVCRHCSLHKESKQERFGAVHLFHIYEIFYSGSFMNITMETFYTVNISGCKHVESQSWMSLSYAGDDRFHPATSSDCG